MTFLFANSSSTLHWKLFEHCVNLDTLSSYSWARAVSDYMNESLTAKAKAKAKKGGEASIGAVSGCTILILFLLCERTNIIQPILGKEKETPAILRWSLVELHTRFNQIKDLNDIEGIFKTPKKRKTTREEEDTVEKVIEICIQCIAVCVFYIAVCILSNAVSESFNLIVQGILKTYKKRKTTGEEGDPLDKEKEKEDDEGKPDDAIQDLLVKSMTDQINYRQQQDPSFVCPERLQLWKDEKNEDSEKKMKELWDIFIQAEKRSKELEVELATYIEKLDNEECVTATMTVESTVQLNEIQNLKRRIAELEGKETGIDMEKIAKKKEIQEKYKAEIESLLSDPTIFEMEMDLPTKQPTQPVEEKEEEKKEEEKQQEEREEEKKQDAPTPDVPSRVQRVKNRERKRLQASCYVYEKNKKTKKEAKKDDEELPQFKLISSEELTQEASQPDATNPIPDPPKGTSLHDSIPVDLQQSSDEDEGQKKQTKKKLGWGLNDEKVTNHDLKDIVWDLELSQNVIEAYIQIEEDKIEPMQTESPQYMSTWTWAYMQSFLEPSWHRFLYEPLLEKLGKCNVLFFPIISQEEFHFTLLTFHKNERKWRHYNPLRSLGRRKEERLILLKGG
ncbi:gelsolin-related protein of 125 kDa-like [Prunus persica]|uniref:gelsolin-related protein of 125 kDa-like n=1 Tax=Prunus persica TaxID=3760 RepID=UPI0009AB33AF|nr:gelsolin-related protein of 125 kDa-like [Prunus persica]